MKKLWKRMLTLVVALAMVITAIGVVPQSAKAANGTPEFGFRWPGTDSNGDWIEDVKQPMNYEMTGAVIESRSHVYFYFIDENGKETKLTADQLRSSDEQVVSIKDGTGSTGVIELEYSKVGTATIEYVYNGTVYQVNVNVILPPVGVYSKNVADSAYLSREYTITDSNNTFYLIGRDDYKITEVALENGLADIASYSISPDGKYAEITVTGTPEDSRWYEVSFCASSQMYGDTNGRWGIQLYDGRPGLKYRWGDYDMFHQSLTLTPDGGDNVFFYFVEGNQQTPVTADNLKSSDTSVVTVSKSEWNPDAVRLEAVGFGKATINYEVGGTTYKMDVSVELPDVGFYTSPTADQNTYVSNFSYTETEDTIYLVGKDGWKITSVSLEKEFADIANVTLDTNKGYATIKITGEPWDRGWYGVCFSAENPSIKGFMDENHIGLEITDARPGLRFRWGDWENGSLIENTEDMLSNLWLTTVDSGCNFFFYFVDGNQEQRLAAKDLKSSDTSVVTVSQSEDNPAAVYLDVVGAGEATITYTVNGKTYATKVISELPDVGFYTSPTADEDTYISCYKLGDNNNEFYLAGSNGWKITAAKLENDFDRIADITLNADAGYAAIKLTEDPGPDGWYGLSFSAENDECDYDIKDNLYIHIIDGKPFYPQLWYEELYVSDTARIESEIEYRDPDGKYHLAEVTDVRQTGGTQGGVDIIKTTKDDEVFWAIYVKKAGTADITITHVDPADPTKTIDHTFSLNIKDKYLWMDSNSPSFSRTSAFPGDVIEKELSVYLNEYDYEKDRYVTKEVTADADFSWKTTFKNVSANTKIDFSNNKVTISFADDEILDNGFDYECLISYSNQGEKYELYYCDWVMISDEYYYVTCNDFPSDFGYGVVANVTPVVKKATYDYDNHLKTESTVTDNIYLGWYKEPGDTYLYRNGEEVDTEETDTENYIKYDPKDVYTFKRGAYFDKMPVALEVFVYEKWNNNYMWHDSYRWRLSETACPHPENEVVLENAKEATCTEDGYTGDKVCMVCRTVVEKGKEIQAEGHKTELKNVKSATCTEAGYTGDKVCKVCDELIEKGEVIKATGHDTELQGVKDVTCTENGYTGDVVCKTCGEIIEKGKVIQAEGHDTELMRVKDVTCTENGYTGDVACKKCGEIFEKGEIIQAEGHKTELKNVKSATCTTDGYTGDTVCTVCKETVKKGEVIPATGHSHKSVIKPATCTTAGEKTYTCACGDTYTEVLPAIGHIYSNGKCTVCGAADPNYKPATNVTPVVKQETEKAASDVKNDIVDSVSSAIKEAKDTAAASGETLSTDKLVETVKQAMEDSSDKTVAAVVDSVSDKTLEKVIVAIEENKDISVTVVAQTVSEEEIMETSKTDANKIIAFVGDNGTVAQYLNLSVLIQAEDADGNVENLGTVDEPTQAFTFTLSVPEELQKDGRTFYVVRVHNDGTAERINVKQNADGTISFTTDKFSTYALAYTDAQAPKTGDFADYMWVYIMIAICGAVLVGTCAVKRRYY